MVPPEMGVLNAGCLLPRRGEERRKDRKNKTCIRGCGWILKMGGTYANTRTHIYTSVQHQLCPALKEPNTKEMG